MPAESTNPDNHARAPGWLPEWLSLDEYFTHEARKWAANKMRTERLKLEQAGVAVSDDHELRLLETIARDAQRCADLGRENDALIVEMAAKAGLTVMVPSSRLIDYRHAYGFFTEDGSLAAQCTGLIDTMLWLRAARDAREIAGACPNPSRSSTPSRV